MDLDPKLIGILAGLGVAFAFWKQIKGLLGRFVGVIIASATVEDGPLGSALKAYCFRELKHVRYGWGYYAGADVFVRPLNRVSSIAYERLGGRARLFWRGWRPLVLKSESGTGTRPAIKLYTIRGLFDIDRLLLDATAFYESLRRSKEIRRFRVVHVVGRSADSLQGPGGAPKESNRGSKHTHYLLQESRLLRWELADIGPPVAQGSAIDDMILPVELHDAVEEARFWRESEAWYRDKRIPWRRGWLLHGPPGTGKTSLARAIAQDLDLPVFAYDLWSLKNEEFRTAWSKMLAETPCMALIEDIDSVFEGRKSLAPGLNPLSFDLLLNCIDGVERGDGVFVVITTNDVSKIDSAIGIAVGGDDGSSRPGRVDRVIEMGLPTSDGLREICARILPDIDPEFARELVDDAVANRETIAQFQERASRVALDLHWFQRPRLSGWRDSDADTPTADDDTGQEIAGS